ncbi:MAG TPA: NADH-quinone oxidoreductase subunit N [Gemmatimonadaceae bacterium]|jgi:NADH-quinone oxidoreductase subunit N|nr:NADH-quinone oxidoreductase subunit N [Gemmatimonadaceae bacterium]
MNFDLSLPAQLSGALGPELLLMGGAMLLLLWSGWRAETDAHQRNVGILSIVLCTLTMILVGYYAYVGYTASVGVIAVDNFRWAADEIFLLATIGTIAMSLDYNVREGITAGESHVLLLLSTSGMMMLAAARDLIIVFLGIELMSIAIYVLAGINRRQERSAEGAIKYFLLGAFSTAFLLYGIALVYGATGETNFARIYNNIGQFHLEHSALLLVGIALLLVGFGFKVAAAPFHMWAPDVYEGAPTPITGYMAAAVKAAAFAAFFRLWLEAFPSLLTTWHEAVWWLAAITMVVGNLVALAQRNIKRLLAYSSIAHAGYILVAVVVGTRLGSSAFLFYLFAYTMATLGAFAVIVALGSRGEDRMGVEEYAGLWSVRPGLAVAMAVFMLALLGFPIFGGIGFFAKWYVLQAALQSPFPQTRLAVVLVVTSLISAGYYLYVVMVMFMKPRDQAAVLPARAGGWTRTVVWASAAIILIFGLFPDAIVSFTRRSAPVLTTDAPGAAPTPAYQRTAGAQAPELASIRPGLSNTGH